MKNVIDIKLTVITYSYLLFYLYPEFGNAIDCNFIMFLLVFSLSCIQFEGIALILVRI
jgi:hypothetical protein